MKTKNEKQNRKEEKKGQMKEKWKIWKGKKRKIEMRNKKYITTNKYWGIKNLNQTQN